MPGKVYQSRHKGLADVPKSRLSGRTTGHIERANNMAAQTLTQPSRADLNCLHPLCVRLQIVLLAKFKI